MIEGLVDPISLRICGQDYAVEAIIDQFNRFSYTDIFCGKSSFELEMPRTARHAEKIRIGRIIHAYDPAKNITRAMIIKQVNINRDTLTASGNEYAADLFSVRLCTAGTDAGDGYDTQTGSIESVMRHYITANITESDVPERQDPMLTLEQAYDRGAVITISARYETVLDILQSCVLAGGESYGWSAIVIPDDDTPAGWRLQWEIIKTVDHSQSSAEDVVPVVLSESFATAVIDDYCDTLPAVNYCLVGGAGEGATRIVQNVGMSSLAGIMRREQFADAGSVSDADELTQRGEEVISDALSTSISMQYLDNPRAQYGRDFRIGDLVTADAGIYGSYDLRVREVVTSWSSERQETTITVGAVIHDVIRLINDVYRNNPNLRR